MNFNTQRLIFPLKHLIHVEPLTGERLANNCLDISIVAVLFIAPLVLGGRHPVGEFAFIVAMLPGAIGLCWKSLQNKQLPLNRLQWCLLLSCLLIPSLQLMPLPDSILHAIAPGMNRLFPADVSTFSGSQTPSTTSLSTWETLRSLPIGIALFTAFLCFLSRLESRYDVAQLVKLIVASGLMLATIAILQAKFGNGKFLWVYDHPSRVPGNIPRGPFQNENHLCSILASLLPCTLYLAFRNRHINRQPPKKKDKYLEAFRSRLPHSCSKRRSRRQSRTLYLQTNWPQWLAIAACILIASTGFATSSRGGIAIMIFAIMAWISFISWSWVGNTFVSRSNYRQWMHLGLALGATVTAGAVTFMYLMVGRFSAWRGTLWAADLKIWQNFPILGVGLGNHRHTYRSFVTEYNPQTSSTAESSWLQFITETGALGFLTAAAIALMALGAAAKYAIHSKKGEPFLLASAVFAGLAASCVHACGDFAWHIPACCVVVLALAAIALRLLPTDQSAASMRVAGDSATKLLASNCLVGCLLLGNFWAVQTALPPARAASSWDAFRRIARTSSPSQNEDDIIAKDSHRMLQLLKKTLDTNPHDLLVRTTLTRHLTNHLEQNHLEMKGAERLATDIFQQANFIANACPLEARSYLCAAIALATKPHTLEQQEELLARSQLLRPIDGTVALKRAINALMKADTDGAKRQFAIALNLDPTSQEAASQVVTLIYPFEEIIETWKPVRQASALIFAQARERASTEQLSIVGRHYCQTLLDEAFARPDASGDLLLQEAFKVSQQIQDHTLSLKIVSKRLESKPRNISLLLERAEIHYQVGEYAATVSDLATCKKINPQDERVRRFSMRVDREASLRVR